jgi:hypothetical protein
MAEPQTKTHPQPITHAEKIQAVKRFISGCQLPANAQTLRVRDLSWTQARDIVLALANLQYFQFDDSIYSQFEAKRDPDGNIVVTPPAEPAANTGTANGSRGRFSIRPGVIRGVQFTYIDSFTNGNDIKKTVTHGSITLLDPRFLVLLTWLCEMLRNNWGVKTLYHLGFLGDTAHSPNNCHHWGRAFDFAGVGGEVGWGKYDITILKHWGKQPVTMPKDWGPLDPKTKKPKYAKGQELPQWPDLFEETTYRIDLPDDPEQFMARVLKMPAFVDYASRVFEAVYNLAAVEAKDTDDPNANPTTIGKDSRYIIHPDHHNTGLRKAHINHIHMQIGPTEHVGFWKS